MTAASVAPAGLKRTRAFVGAVASAVAALHVVAGDVQRAAENALAEPVRVRHRELQRRRTGRGHQRSSDGACRAADDITLSDLHRTRDTRACLRELQGYRAASVSRGVNGSLPGAGN